MGEERLHVVFGTGQVGSALAAHLGEMGITVRTVSRNRPRALADGADWRAADVTDPEAATDAAKGASVVYQCLNAPYNQWPEHFPPLQRGVLAAAEANGALLVSLENLCGYGPNGGRPMTEDLPLAATDVKGRTRAAMAAELLAAAEAGRVRVAIGRASDFFGAGVTHDGKTTPRGAPRNPLQLGATFWHFRHESRVTSPPIWAQNLMLPPLWALAKVFGVRPYYDRWDSHLKAPQA
jgi:nucleoside-diphosphate-sugar epimerase